MPACVAFHVFFCPRAPAYSAAMIIDLIELLAVIFVGVMPSVVTIVFWRQLKEDDLETKYALRTVMQLVHSMGAILLVLFIALRHEQGLLSIGLDFSRFEDLFPGVLAYSLLVVSYALTGRLIKGRKDEVDVSRYDIRMMLLAKGGWQKLLRIVALVLAVLAEELVFRGYFLHLWAERSGAVEYCALASSIVFVLLHLYQGKKFILYHVCYAAILAGLTIWSGGIMMAIGAHLYGNLLIQLKLWRMESKGMFTPPVQPPPMPELNPAEDKNS